MVSRATVREMPYSCCSPSRVSRLPGASLAEAMAMPTASRTRSCIAGEAPPSFASSASCTVAVDIHFRLPAPERNLRIAKNAEKV
jgi:hypothetical protein